MVPNMEEPLVVGNVEKIGGPGESLVVIEVKKQMYLAGPLIVGSLLQNIIQMISVMFVGHLGELSLSSASIATSFAAVTGFSLLVCYMNFISYMCCSFLNI
jgi:MATE family multidrug resistance protein